MRPAEIPLSLPPVRSRVFRHSLRIVALYIVLGTFMTAAVYVAGGLAPKALHLNYDSISAAMKMSRSWNALRNPEQHAERSEAEWSDQFEKAISFEESNITEPGEGDLAKRIRALWEVTKRRSSAIGQRDFERMENDLDSLIAMNERGMSGWAAESQALRRRVISVSVIVFLFSILIALYLADGLAVRIATPLRELSAALKTKPEPGSRLKLPPPNTLEMKILTSELLSLWQRVSELQKLNLEEISSQRKQLETVLASVEDAILVFDNQGRIVHCNKLMSQLIGLEPRDLLGFPWADLSTASNSYSKLREALQPEMATDQTVELSVAGSRRSFSARYRAIIDEKRVQIGSLYLLHDVTEIKHKERLKNEFIGVLSHELKTPLQSLGTASELLLKQKSSLDEDGQMLVETIYEDVGRIRGVANEFVQVGLIDLHSLRLKMEPVIISTLIEQWIRPFQVLAKDRNVKLEFLQGSSGSITARIDPVKFPWAIANLLSNAIRVSPAGSAVTVYLSDNDRSVDIEVRDEGPGIPHPVRERMFEPFFQYGQHGQHGQQGQPGQAGFLGLGLTIAKEVVEAHEGWIEYLERASGGSVFRISLPRMIL